MAKKYYVKDEELGGIEREYVESEEKAEVGDYVHIEYYDEKSVSTVGLTSKIHINGKAFYIDYIQGDDLFYYSEGPLVATTEGDRYKTLVPTGNVRIDGEIYRMVDRKAQVGEKVIIVKNTSDGFSEGAVGKVSEELGGGNVVVSRIFAHTRSNYRVLEPVASQESDKTTADLLASLSREVVRLRKKAAALEEQTDSNAKDIVTFAEELTEHKAEHDHGRHSGKFETLDERLQRADAEDLAHNVARFVSDYLKEGLRYERNN